MDVFNVQEEEEEEEEGEEQEEKERVNKDLLTEKLLIFLNGYLNVYKEEEEERERELTMTC